ILPMNVDARLIARPIEQRASLGPGWRHRLEERFDRSEYAISIGGGQRRVQPLEPLGRRYFIVVDERDEAAVCVADGSVARERDVLIGFDVGADRNRRTLRAGHGQAAGGRIRIVVDDNDAEREEASGLLSLKLRQQTLEQLRPFERADA